MSAPNDGGSAFPHPGYHGIDGKFVDVPHVGMTLRDWFAGQALPAIISDAAFYQQKAVEEKVLNSYNPEPWQVFAANFDQVDLADYGYDCALAAYAIADSMLQVKKEDEE
jgi:hypothetical protein